MKLTVEIHPYELEVKSKVAFYSFYILGSDDQQLEIEKFYKRFVDEPYASAVRDLQALIQTMAEEFGAPERSFRKEGKAHALPSHGFYHPLLRLYCLRCSDSVVILGNGGIKSSQAAKDSPDCYPHFLVMNGIANAFRRERIKCGDLPLYHMPLSLQIEMDD